MSDDWEKYKNDPRMICKYGAKCYQKNPVHHESFKHPPVRNNKRPNNSKHVKVKRARLDDDMDDHKKDVATNVDANAVGTTNTVHKDDENESVEEIKPTVYLPKHLDYYSESMDEDLIKELFLLRMPKDFYKLFQCLKTENLEKSLLDVNLQLIGPYELLLGKLPKVVDKELYLIHWRFFYDPPEFQSVLKSKGKSQFHMGYYRDTPDEDPVFVGSNDSAKDCVITPMAYNLFGAIYMYLQTEKKRSPFTSMACQKFMEKIKTWAEECGMTLKEFDMKLRQKSVVTKTLHHAGIVVPYNKKTKVGYRPLVENNNAISKIFTRLEAAKSQDEKDKVLSDLQPVITYASIAVDECDFGTGLECGINLLCSGIKELEASAQGLLCSTYSLLKRDIFSTIIEAHLKYRHKGPEMSLLSLRRK